MTEEGVIAKTLGSAALGGAAGTAFGGAYGGPVGAAVGGVAGAISGAKLGYKIGVATALDKAEKDYGFITDNYSYKAIMSHLSQNFLKEITEELIKNRLENPDHFLVREFPD